MRKLARYLKPYVLPVLLCVALLFVQAMCDLNLPNMMSKIVNVGIQQGGIEEGAPEAIGRDTLDFLLTLMPDEDREIMETSYAPPASGSADVEKRYPAAAEKEILLLTAGGDEALRRASGAYSRGVMTFVNLMKDTDVNGKEGENARQAEGTEGMDLSMMAAMRPMLEQLPAETVEAAQQASAALDDSSRNQTGVMMTRAIYQDLGMDTEQMRSNYVLKTGGYMLLLTLAGALAAIGVGLLAARVSAGIARTIRRDVFNKVEHFSNREFDEFSTASLITRSTNDVTQVQMLVLMGMRMLCYAPIMGVGGVVMAVGKSVSMTWIIAVGVLILIGMMSIIFSAVMPKSKLAQKLIDRLNLVTRENLSGMMVIRAFGTQKFEENRFEKANKNLMKNQLFVFRVMSFMMPAMMFLMNAVTLVIVWVGAYQIEQSAMQVGDMMAFMQYGMQIIMSFLMISMMFIMVPRAAVSGDRIAEILETESTVTDPKEPETLGGRAKGVIEFRDVSFRYSNAEDDVLQDITFTAKPGQTTAFIGSTGSGKSTLINLIPRFYDPTAGKILLDGVNIKKLTMHELRENIGYVPQKGILFSGDIAANLRYGTQEASDADIAKAAEVAQAEEFISAFPNGMDTSIAQGGGNVSGGQKQRLSIARALTRKAPVYIFDDSFSALDFKTDAALRHALKAYTGEATVLLVAQRVSTIMNAEQIVVLDEGKIVGIGTHGELLKNCPLYREIAASQLSEEELSEVCEGVSR